MASKFQNRLVGTIILVVLGVIILPNLLDGKKKHYQDKFVTMPLMSKPGNRDERDMTPPPGQQSPYLPSKIMRQAEESS